MTPNPERSDFLLASPYGQAFEAALDGFFACAKFFHRKASEGEPNLTDTEITSRLNTIFFEALKGSINRNDNPHLTRGLISSLNAEPRTGRRFFYRPTLIFKRLFVRALLIESEMQCNRDRLAAARKRKALEDDPIEVLFSPYFFLRQYLTDPAFLASDAYAHALIRAHIFAEAVHFEKQRSTDREATPASNHPFALIREIIKFDRVERSVRKIERHSKIGDNVAPANATDFIVMHLLASRGYLLMRFGRKVLRDRHNQIRITRQSFVDDSLFVPPPEMTYEFRVLPEVARLPIASELMSEIDGLPLPIAGSDAVLYRGLRFTEESGVVMRFSGATGTGKTSVALGIAVALAPLGTRTVYLSCEEKSVDLEHRIQTLVSEHVRRMDVFQRLDKNWFSAEYIGGTAAEKFGKVQSFLNLINTKFEKHIKRRWETPPGTMPLLIVIDGVHELFLRDRQPSAAEEARDLIERCRNTGALVIVLSAKNLSAVPDDLDYLVDFVAGLDFAPTKDPWERLVRTITVQKTRRQPSRVGAHVLHISGRQGLRISPQVASQLDQRRNFKWVEPRNEFVYDFLLRPQMFPRHARKPAHPLVQLYDRSQILITGTGSNGKSAFAFKLLTTSLLPQADIQEELERAEGEGLAPLMRRQQRSLFEENDSVNREEFDYIDSGRNVEELDLTKTWYTPITYGRRKFLILSFLYEEAYYRKLWRRISPYRLLDAKEKSRCPSVDFNVHTFSPGYLRPEDFLTIIAQEIERHELEGWPYDGVLIDGLHNVYLQFPYLEQSEMVWPMLFQMLRTHGLTVVTTHTYFTIDPGVEAARLDLEDVDSARRRAAPLLHAIVQATDFRISVSAEKWDAAETLHQHFNGQHFDTRVDVLGAIGQPVATEPLYWDRDRGVVIAISARDRAAILRGPR